MRLLNTFLRLITLGNAVAHLSGLRGLSWSNRLALPFLTLAWSQPASGWRSHLALLLPAFIGQIGLATLRRRQLDPKQQLRPGRYPNRQIVRLDLPARHGPVPALHIVPHGGSKTAVLVTHGSGCDKTFYAWRLVDRLIAHGAAALLIDLDGHGDSPRPQAFPHIVDSVADPIDWLRQRYTQVGAIGMSLGGAVLARAIANGADVDALALWEVPPRLRLDARAYRQVQIREALAILQLRMLHLFRDGAVDHVIRAWQTSGIRATISTWDLFDALAFPDSLRTLAWREPPLPTLLVYAGRDAIVPPAAAAEVAALAAGWAEYRLLPFASHISLPIDLECITLTVDWLARHLNQPAFTTGLVSE
ncbi:alpha/beta hydrolase [Chloroflexus sp.]|uniref:alpha/beta hydrolase n=1 Tax=Chloroflexus sp. TaxID=1904827 RepID=UPI002ADE612E|nr:alpha/beta fold hydrolase [Chloroflexus sp.]